MFDGAAFGKEMVGIVRGYVDKAVAPLVERLTALEAREPLNGKDGADGRDGSDGKDADPEAIAALVREEVERAVAALPKPQDGKSVTADDLAPLIDQSVSTAVSEAVKAIPVPKDGRDGRDGLDAVTPLLKDGVLLFTMSDGSVKEVGQVQGRDGADGAPGRDGADGLGFDDLDVIHDGERGITLRFSRDEVVKEFAFSVPMVIDRGVWSEARDGGYAKGDGVTWAGSFWISQKDGNTDKPDGGDGWRLSVKRGRDGKPGKDGEIKAREPVKVG